MTNEVYNNPSVPVIPSPIGLDKAIAYLQGRIATLPWITKSFGRARDIPSNVGGKKVVEPMVYQGGGEYYSALPNDSLVAYSFFRVTGERKFNEYTAGGNEGSYLMTDPVDLIVWGNLKAIDSTKDYVFTEELIKNVLDILSADPNVVVTGIVDEDVSDIFRGIPMNDTKRDLLMYPYMAFRVSLNLSYTLTEC